MGENMPLQQWELYESMSVLNDSCTTKTTTTICNAPGTSQGYRRSGDGASTNTTTAAAAAGNDWSLAAGESQQQCAVKKRPAADDSLNTFPAAAAATAAEAIAAVGNIERRMTKKINIVKENTDETDQNRNSDENLQFLLSLLPYLRDVPKHRKLSVRHKLQKVFIDEQEKSLAAFTGYHQPAVPVTRATATVPNAVRGPPPPSYPGKNDFGFVTPAQNLNAFNNNNNNKNTTKTVPIHCSALVQCNNVDDNPSLPKPYNNCCAIKNCSFNNDSVCSNDVPLLNVDYTASVKPTIYYNTNIFSTQQQQQQQPGTVFVTSGNVVNSADYSVVAAAAAAAAAQRTDLHYNNNFVTPAASTHTRPGSTSLNIIGTATVADIATSTLDFSADSYNNNNNVNNNVIATVIAAAEETDNDSWTYRAM